MITKSILRASKHKERCEKTEKSKMFIKDFVSPAFSEIEHDNKIVNKIIMNYELFEDIVLSGEVLIGEDMAFLWTADVVFDDSYGLDKFTLKYQEDFVNTGSRDFIFNYDKFFGAKKVDHKINKNKYGHDWVKRGTCVAPFVCSQCGALSGSSAAVSLCGCDNKKVDNDSEF